MKNVNIANLGNKKGLILKALIFESYKPLTNILILVILRKTK